MALITRSGAGRPLTFEEADNNWNTLENRTGEGWFDNVSQLYLRDTENSADPAPFVGGISLRRFIQGEMKEAFAEFHIPHIWRPGSNMFPHVHFTILNPSAGTVRWGFEYCFARTHRSEGVIRYQETTTTIFIEQVVPAGSERIHFVAESDVPIPGADLEVDGMILARLFRDGAHPNDTFPGEAFGITVDLHTEVDRISTPFRFPPFYTAE